MHQCPVLLTRHFSIYEAFFLICGLLLQDAYIINIYGLINDNTRNICVWLVTYKPTFVIKLLGNACMQSHLLVNDNSVKEVLNRYKKLRKTGQFYQFHQLEGNILHISSDGGYQAQ